MTTQPRILIWDIETTNLNATFGTCLCIGWKWYGEEEVTVHTILDTKRKRDMLDDKHVIEAFVKAFNECDYHSTWYGDRFDLPFVKSKMILYGMQPPAPKPTIDLWKTARKNFKLHSNRLVVWQDFLGVDAAKTPLDFNAWLKAAHGDKASIDEVKEHCRQDVLVLEDIYERMRPWLENEPVRGLFTGEFAGCPSCGSTNVQKRGFKVAATRIYQQYQCQDCGRWYRDTRSKVAAPTRNTG